MKWHADIQSVTNGFIVEYSDGEGKRKVIYQNLNTLGGDLSPTETDKSHIVDMLYELLDFFGEQGCKWDKKRIKITYEKQN